MRQLLPVPIPDVDLDAAYAPPAQGSWVRANFAISLDGAVERDGKSDGVSGPADKRVFAVLRGLADVVLVGAATARIEGYRPARSSPERRATRLAAGKAPVPTIAVVTSDLGLDFASELFTATEVRPILLTTATASPDRVAAAASVADVVICGDRQVDVAVGLDALHKLGHRVVLCEGGPNLLGQLVAAGRLDELCLTVSPMLVGPGHHTLAGGPASSNSALLPTGLTVGHVLEQDSTLFLRYRR